MKFSELISKYKLQSLPVWIIVFGIWFYFRYQDYSTPGLAFKVTLIKVTDLALLVAIANNILVPRFLYRRKYLLFSLFFILMVITSSILKMYILGTITNNPALLNWTNNWKARVYDNVIPHIFLVIAGTSIRLMLDYIRMQTRVADLAKQKAEAELNFLKSQINPHFLFNSLNTIYFQIHKDNVEARETLHKFSDMLRYQVYELNGKPVPIEKEIKFLEDYVSLQKLRKDDHYQVNFRYDMNLHGFTIEPLLLIPLVENAFKHISHSKDQRNYVDINMRRTIKGLNFFIENSTENNKHPDHLQGGVGLKNVKRRLELVYEHRHDIEIIQKSNSFQVILNIDINNNL